MILGRTGHPTHRTGPPALTIGAVDYPGRQLDLPPADQPRVDVDTDLKGDVRGGSRLPVGISAEYVKGAPDTGMIGGDKPFRVFSFRVRAPAVAEGSCSADRGCFEANRPGDGLR